MREIARRSDKDRRDLFGVAAQRMGVHAAIVEKDFWVCWVLDYLFQEIPWKERLAFKGGTSLSKAYGAIQRFSEDIDLILDWRVLGYSSEEPNAPRSVSRQEVFCDEANRRTAEYLLRDFVPQITLGLSERVGRSMPVEARGQDVLIRYPRAFTLAAVQPTLRLEIGPIAAWKPNAPRNIRPYAAEQVPEVFKQSTTTVPTISAERTFWEKATILHQEAHRSAEKPLPPRYSRHYYDLYRMTLLPIRERALERIDLLKEVADFKTRFYRCPWARYEEAKPGSLRLLPPSYHEKELRKDYAAMAEMLFGDIPSLDNIIEGLGGLEAAINAMRTGDG